MSKNVQAKDFYTERRKKFETELKIYVNQRLYDKKVITEEMYMFAKDFLINKAG
ncbi:MAG: hypothetical protein IJE46_03960 [Clostridia bacterium]|nr:hypothetical protein [Clostridia bacterium]